MPTEVEELGENAERCLRLTRVVEDENTKVILEEIASEFESRAASQYSKASA